MDEALFGAIDWQRPWLAPFRTVARAILQAEDWRAALNREAAKIDLRNHRQLPICFVPQSELRSNIAYEQFISQTGCVPTRENVHDFFNALVWLTFPRIKAQLNALQAQEIEKADLLTCVTKRNAGANRGRVRDAATIFDENAALMMTSETGLLDALRAHDWQEVFIRQRDAFGLRCELHLFGHALMEKLVSPYKAITSHVWVMPVASTYFEMPEESRREWIDDAVTSQLTHGLTMKDFTPLPVLGVPGWWQGQEKAFYADVSVFRPRKRGALPS
jgi:hypothetical protein